jgi:F-type H+-transporting ATPase subunit alpha
MSKSDQEFSTTIQEKLDNLSEKIEKDISRSKSSGDFLEKVKQQVKIQREIKPQKQIKSMIDTLSQSTQQMTTRVRFKDVGTVQHIGNGVATVSGLPNVCIDEIVTFPTGVEGMALNLERKSVDLIMIGSENGIRGGDLVEATGARLRIPVGGHVMGRIMDPLGNPIDRDEPIEASEYRFFSKIAPDVIKRSPVNQSLFTGTKIIDALFPIGRGQRELILGDRQTGKTTLAVDAILSQKNTGVRCIYVAVGQKMSSSLAVIDTLRKNDALSNTAVILSNPDDQPALRYLAPYTGMTMAEYFLDQGLDVLIVFDDLSKHANAYRELSLLLRRPPGREAYPGDIFYIHSRLLERACKLNEENGRGSITALPIAVTQNGNLSSYIPTNLISITDGQLVLDADLFNQGQKPAIDVGRSVSRVGSAAQQPAMRELAENLKLELSQYKEVEHFTRFGTEIDKATRQQIARGKRILNTLTQKPNQPYSFPITIVILYSLNRGFISQIPIEKIEEYGNDLREYFSKFEKKLLTDISKEGCLTDAITEGLNQALEKFSDQWIEEKGLTQ